MLARKQLLRKTNKQAASYFPLLKSVRMSHYITTHNSDGKAVFSDKIPTTPHTMPIPIGTIQMLSSTHSFPMNLSTEQDIERYEDDRNNKFFPGIRRTCPDTGTAACIITMNPGAVSGMHRTSTLDTIVVTQGVIEIHLDSGEKKVIRAGDSLVQRNTMHKWVNVTPENGHAQIVAFLQAVEEPMEIGDKKLYAEWLH